MKLTLTESDLSTITNALTGLAIVCENDAASAHADAESSPAAKRLADAVLESAQQYHSLAEKIGAADTIAVDLS